MSSLPPAKPAKAPFKVAFAQRLGTAIGEEPIARFAMRCAMSESLLRKYLSADSLPGTDKLVSLARAAEVCLEWLATGDGPMSRSGPSAVPAGDAHDEGGLTHPPHYVAELGSDGRTRVNEGAPGESVVFRRSWAQHELGVDPENLAVLTVRGDSMEPNIWEGDVVILDTSQTRVTDDTVYVLIRDGYLVVKRLQRNLDGSLRLKNDNPSYEAEFIPNDQVGLLYVAGRVVWTGGKL